MRLATNISKDNLIALGTCVGKFTKSGKFHLTIHALDYLAQYAKVSKTQKKGNITSRVCFFVWVAPLPAAQ
jgi:ribosome biogenesis protein Nip4